MTLNPIVPDPDLAEDGGTCTEDVSIFQGLVMHVEECPAEPGVFLRIVCEGPAEVIAPHVIVKAPQTDLSGDVLISGNVEVRGNSRVLGTSYATDRTGAAI